MPRFAIWLLPLTMLVLSGCAATGSGGGGPRSGVVERDGYSVVIAGQGDTVASLADRAGIEATGLAAFNGIALDTPLRAGDELALPPTE